MPEPEIDLRSAMSLYPTGVCVVTMETGEQPAFGMTVNSFTSLSLDPPLVMWNLQKSSDNFKEWREAEGFAVNMLTTEQRALSVRFAGKGNHELQNSELDRGVTGCPLLLNSLANLECRMHARYEEGDHVIMIGEVVSIRTDAAATPLAFLAGRYGNVSCTD